MKRLSTLMLSVGAAAALSVSAPMAASAAPSDFQGGIDAAASCPSGHICVYNATDFGGSQWNMSKCGIIHNIGLDWGSDQVRSYVNNQTGGVTATFYNWTGHEWVPIGTSAAGERVSHAPGHFSSVPGGVDGVRAC